MIVSVCTRVNRQKILYDSGICSVYAKHILSSSWMGRKEKINIHKKKKKITLFTFHFISDFFFHSFCVFACGYFTWLEAYISTYTHCLDPSSLITMDTFMLHFFFWHCYHLALIDVSTFRINIGIDMRDSASFGRLHPTTTMKQNIRSTRLVLPLEIHSVTSS